MGCKLSIGIKGDNTNQRPSTISPLVTHEQSTSPIRLATKTNITTQTTPKSIKSVEIQKDYAEKESDYKPPDAEDNGTESEHSNSKNRWKSKALAVGTISRGSRVQHCDR